MNRRYKPNDIDKRYNLNNTETHKQCPLCLRILPRTDYHIGRNYYDGLFPRCKECTVKTNAERYQRGRQVIAERRQALKKECVALLGGKCSRCAYCEFVSSLDFHHLSDKEHDIAALITKSSHGNRKQHDILMEEISKCILLCSNCHSAFHAGEWS